MRASLRIESAGTLAAGLNAPLKIGLCALASVTAMFMNSPYGLAVMLVAAMAFALTAARLRVVLRALLFTSLMLVFSFAFSLPLSYFFPQLLRWDALSLSVPFLRFLVVILLVVALALSTSVRSVSDTLASLRLPGFILIPMLVAVRFIPTFLEDCRQIREATRLRPGGGILSFWRGTVVPLLFRVLSSASDLAVAAELKGVNATKRIARQGPKPLAKADYTVLCLAALTVCAAFAIQTYGPQVASVMP